MLAVSTLPVYDTRLVWGSQITNQHYHRTRPCPWKIVSTQHHVMMFPQTRCANLALLDLSSFKMSQNIFLWTNSKLDTAIVINQFLQIYIDTELVPYQYPCLVAQCKYKCPVNFKQDVNVNVLSQANLAASSLTNSRSHKT